MAQDKGLLRVYTELPSWAKGVVVVGGLAIGYLAVTSIISSIKGAANEKKQQKEVDTAKDELQQQINSGNKPTISRSTAEAISNGLIAAAQLCGTDDSLFLGEFDNIANQADMLLLVDVFGLRKKMRCPFTSDSYDNPWCIIGCETKPMSLSALVAGELSISQIRGLNDKLARKGITYRF
jgi:hypothetical protein